MTQIQSDKKNPTTSNLLQHQKPRLSPSMPRRRKCKVGTGLSAPCTASVATVRKKKKKVWASLIVVCLFVSSCSGTWPECTVSANSRLQLLLSVTREEAAKLSGQQPFRTNTHGASKCMARRSEDGHYVT